MEYIYHEGRVFISPLIGCNGGCKYCYLPNEIEKFDIVRENKYKINKVIEKIKRDERVVLGKSGTIISIGAYCDIFPMNDKEELTETSIEWIVECLKLGNPVQIISKNLLDEKYVKELANQVQYENQLLYSTTITTVNKWSRIEPYTANPEKRLYTLALFKKHNIPTNLMIKPFIPGITDKEIDKFKEILRLEYIDYAVVGELYLTTSNVKEDEEKVSRILDCTGEKKFKTLGEELLKDFINKIKDENKVFRKSSCVNANLLKVNNQSSYYLTMQGDYCVGCNNCK